MSVLQELGNKLIAVWLKHCTDEDLSEYNREIMDIKKKYENKGVRFIEYDPLSLGIIVQYKGHVFFIDLWPMWENALISDWGPAQEVSGNEC